MKNVNFILKLYTKLAQTNKADYLQRFTHTLIRSLAKWHNGILNAIR